MWHYSKGVCEIDRNFVSHYQFLFISWKINIEQTDEWISECQTIIFGFGPIGSALNFQKLSSDPYLIDCHLKGYVLRENWMPYNIFSSYFFPSQRNTTLSYHTQFACLTKFERVKSVNKSYWFKLYFLKYATDQS